MSAVAKPAGLEPKTEFFALADGPRDCEIGVSRFQGASGVEECHLVIRPTEEGSFHGQLEALDRAYQEALAAQGLDLRTGVFRRFFCSDLHNQAGIMAASPITGRQDSASPCAVSWAGQPPIPPAKLSLWAYHVRDPAGDLDKSGDGAHLVLRRNGQNHHWTTGITSPGGGTAYDQTRVLFEGYDRRLRADGLSLADHVMRTWLFVQNMDADYQGLVAARREFFAAHGLTADTHFIASSGIGGAPADVRARVVMDAYAISGLQPGQVAFLAAPDHLSPTHVYGVTFERGTSITYRDRKHMILSGTASIDACGNILYHGDVSRQLERTLENVEALLAQARAGLDDVCVFIVYVRDPADLETARRAMSERFGHVPVAVLLAPVCRPGWLIEVEGLAIVPASNPNLPAF